KNKVRCNIAMTGEITLRGKILPIGGLKEKLLAAYRENITTILIPKENERNLKEIPKNLRKAFTIIPVDKVEDVFKNAIIFKKSSRKLKKKSTVKKKNKK
ncbi:endopeptidase La, partial [Candidatus Dependentiae bacterium]|nr:endopeptidase La [Candidatus Dependentiae bacterium]